MATYTAKVKTRHGVKQVSITARTNADARRHAEKMGKVLAFKKDFGIHISTAMTQADRQIFFTRLSSMLASKVGTSDALTLIRDTFSGKIQEVASRLLAFVEGGDDLTGAFSKVGAPDFPEATIALISAGSRSGETWRAIRDAAEFEYQLHNIRKNANKGLIGGIIGFLVAGITTVGSTLYVAPAIMGNDLIKSAKGVDIGWIITTGNVLGYIMGVMMAVFIGFLLFTFFGKRLFPVRADKVILKVPYYKDLVLARNNFIVLYGLALLIKSGVRTEEALRLSAEAAPRGALRQDLKSAETAVRMGRPWAKAMDTLHPTDKAALLCAVDREQVGNTLDTLANQYRELYAQRLSSFVPAINLVSALFLSIAGGILFGTSILPMLQAMNGLGV